LSNFSFRVVQVPGQAPAVAEIEGTIPAGVFQISGHDNTAEDNASGQVSVSVVQHDSEGQAVVGATGYRGA